MKLYDDDPQPSRGDWRYPIWALLVVALFVGAVVSLFL